MKRINTNSLEDALEISYRFLTGSDKTELQVKNKLLSKEFDEEVVNKCLDTLKQKKYIDDLKFCLNFSEYKKNVWGEKRIKEELRQKGVSSYVIDEALKDFLEEETIAEKILQSKLKGKDISDFKDRQKLYSFLIRRGFSHSCCSKVMKKICEDDFLEDVSEEL